MARISDTHPDAERVQLDLLRAAGEQRRFALMRSLSETVIAASRRALRDTMPEATETEVLLRWVALNYGAELGERLASHLARRPR
jgi:hypothetical protein